MAPAAWRGAALAVLLIAPAVAGQMAPSRSWSQGGGGPGHEGWADLTVPTLDVVSSWRMFEDEIVGYCCWQVPGMVWTPHGLAAIRVDGGDDRNNLTDDVCTLFLVTDPRAGATRDVNTFPCQIQGAQVLAYDPVRDLLLVCVPGFSDQPVLQALDPRTADVLWAVTPARIGMTTPIGTFYPSGSDAIDAHAQCGGVALDAEAGDVVVPFFSHGHIGRSGRVEGDFGDHRIAKLALDDGEVLFSVRVPVTRFLDGAPSAPIVEATGTNDFYAYGVTKTGTGYVVAGAALVPTNRPGTTETNTLQLTLVWLSADGPMVGRRLGQNAMPATREDNGQPGDMDVASSWAAASGNEAAALLGDHLLVVDPSISPVSREAIVGVPEGREFNGFVVPPVWSGDTIVVPFGRSVMAFDADTLEPRWDLPWSDHRSSRAASVAASLVVPPNDLYVLVARNTSAGGATDEVALSRVDLTTGLTAQRLRLAMPANLIDGPGPIDAVLPSDRLQTSRWPGHLMPMPDGSGVLAWAYTGEAVFLGAADPADAPVFEVSDPYVPVAIPLEVTPTVTPGATPSAFVVAWGDGDSDDVAPGATAQHQYDAAGPLIVRVTAVYADGHTATSEAPVDVGGSPPPDLNPIQDAFATEHQDLTFGVLGLLIAIVGAFIAVFAKRRHRSRIERGMAALQAVRVRAREDPHGAVREIAAFRDRLRDDLTSGRLNDSQFSVLRNESTQLLRSLHHRILAPLEGKLSARYARLLESAIEDNTLTQTELRELTEALETERGLTVQERLHLAKLVQAWT